MAQTGNGVDLAAVYRLLLQMSGRLDSHERKLDDLSVGLSDLRVAVTNYHGAALGHGVLISELDERVRRIERHLKLEPSGE